MKPPANTYGGGADQTAVIGHAPESRDWKPGDPAYAPIIHKTARIEPFATIDCGTRGPTRVDEGSWIFRHAHVGHDAWVQAGAEVGTTAVIGGHVVVERGARIGLGAIVLPYRVVGAGAVVGAGSVVTHDVPAGATVCGNPARLLEDHERDPRPHSVRRDVNARFYGRNAA